MLKFIKGLFTKKQPETTVEPTKEAQWPFPTARPTEPQPVIAQPVAVVDEPTLPPIEPKVVPWEAEKSEPVAERHDVVGKVLADKAKQAAVKKPRKPRTKKAV